MGCGDGDGDATPDDGTIGDGARLSRQPPTANTVVARMRSRVAAEARVGLASVMAARPYANGEGDTGLTAAAQLAVPPSPPSA